MKPRYVHIVWLDHSCVIGWVEPEQAKNVALITSIGILVREDKDSITISTSVTNEGAYTEPLTILKKTIISRRTIKVNSRKGK